MLSQALNQVQIRWTQMSECIHSIIWESWCNVPRVVLSSDILVSRGLSSKIANTPRAFRVIGWQNVLWSGSTSFLDPVMFGYKSEVELIRPLVAQFVLPSWVPGPIFNGYLSRIWFCLILCEGIDCSSQMNSDFVPTIDAAEERFIMHIALLTVGWSIKRYALTLMCASVSWAYRHYRCDADIQRKLR
jgi:hypothetical protein